MASLTGKKLKDSYDSLLKVQDNDALSNTKKKITDGFGNESGLSLDDQGNVDVQSNLEVGGSLSVGGVLDVNGVNNSGALYDSNGSVGTPNQVLSSTGTGTDWISLDLEFATDAQLQAEAQLRANADASLQSDIDNEIQQREFGDNALNQLILGEEVSRIAADNTLQSNIDTEEASRISADNTLQSNISNEATIRANADISLQDSIDLEQASRILADSTLQTNLTAEGQIRLNQDNILTQAIADEADSRLAADNQLQENINQEAQARSNADGVLQANIDAEESARISGDANLEATKVPYTGATQDVNIGTHRLTATSIKVAGGTGNQGILSWNPDDQTLDLIVSDNVTYQIGQELGHVVRNESGQDIGNGKIVKVTGAQSSRITIEIADNGSEYNSASTFAVVTEPINRNQVGRVTTEGLVRGLDTSAFAEGIAIWLGENGQFTDVKPQSPKHLVHIGWVVRSHPNDGSILVRVSNGWEMEELHDVLITNVQAGHILQWDAVASLWVNTNGLDDIYQSLSGDIASVQLNLNAEINTRISADATLASSISGEASTREFYDNQLQAQITSNDADITTLQDDLADEVIARQQGDTILHNDIVDEANTRAAEDANLQAQITSNDSDIADLYATKEDKANKGVANGYASLDASGKVPEAQLPDSVLGALEYQGTWDALTNTPTLPTPDVSNNGHYYKVSVEGTYLGEVYHVGDWAVSNGTEWQHIHTTETISSVFGRTGDVTAIEADYSAFYPLISDLENEILIRSNADNNLQGQITSNDNDIAALQAGVSQNASDIAAIDLHQVTSVGNTTPNTITTGGVSTINVNASNLNATTNVTARRLELGGSDFGFGGNIVVLDNLDENLLQVSGTGVQIGSLATPIDTYSYGQVEANSIKKIGGTSAQFLKADGSVDNTAYIPVGGAPAPNNATITITSGSGLTGSGDFTTDQAVNETITISHADTSAQPSVTGTTNTFVDGVTLDTYGHVTGLTTQSVTIPNPNNATITLSAGSGMTGGGDFTTDQGTNETITISHADTSLLSGVYGSTASGTKINEITIDGFGHITAITTGATGDVDGVTAGTGLTGGGTSGTITISHADTSTQASVNNSGRTFIQDITLDDFGHITGIVSATDSDTYVGTVTSVATGGGLTGGTITSSGTISHADTSAQASINNSNGVVIQDVTLDTYGHVTSLGSVDLDGRYYTESEADSRFINASGDTMSGTLTLSAISGTDQMVENNYGAYLHLGNWAVGRTDPSAVLVNTAYRADYADNLFDMNISRFTNNSGYITSSGRAYPRRVGGGDLNFNWSGQSGQPPWLWGGSDGTNMYVYNPANFNVNSATTANISNQVSINYNNDSNSGYQILWGSGNSVYGTSQVYINPYLDKIYAKSFQAELSGTAGTIEIQDSYDDKVGFNTKKLTFKTNLSTFNDPYSGIYGTLLELGATSYSYATSSPFTYSVLSTAPYGETYLDCSAGSSIIIGSGYKQASSGGQGSSQTSAGYVNIYADYGFSYATANFSGFYSSDSGFNVYTNRSWGGNIFSVLNQYEYSTPFGIYRNDSYNYTINFYESVAYSNGFFTYSDIDKKENVKEIDNALSIVSDLRGVNFDWKKTKENAYGFIAQELIKVVPQAVQIDTDGNHLVEYTQIIGIHNEAIKELKAEIELLKQQLNVLRNE